jgi:hypothetical protein
MFFENLAYFFCRERYHGQQKGPYCLSRHPPMHLGSYGFFRDPGSVEAARDKLYNSSIRLYGAFHYLQDYKNYGNHRLP